MYRKIIRNESGFTLVEVLVSIAILGIILGAGISVFVVMSQSADKALVLEQLRYDGLRIMDQINREVKQSKNVEYSNSGNVYLRIALDNQSLDCVQYSFHPVAGGNGYMTRCSGTCVNLAAMDSTSCPKFTDDSQDSGLDIKAVSYAVYSPVNRPKNVYITLTIGQNNLTVSRQAAEITINRSVSLRSY